MNTGKALSVTQSRCTELLFRHVPSFPGISLALTDLDALSCNLGRADLSRIGRGTILNSITFQEQSENSQLGHLAVYFSVFYITTYYSLSFNALFIIYLYLPYL